MTVSSAEGDHIPARLPPSSRVAPSRSAAEYLVPASLAFGSAHEGDGQRIDVLAYWRTILKRRWVIVFCLAAVLAAGVAITLLTRPAYTATSTLQIDREETKVVDKADGTPIDNMVTGEEFFQTQYGLLRSRSLAIRVAESLGLTRDDAFIKQMGFRPRAGAQPDPEAARTVRRDQVLGILLKRLAVSPDRGSRLVSVSFHSPDPALSARIANAFAENFIAAALDRRYESSSYARDFLEKRLAEVKAKLEDTERDLVAYAASQQIIQLSEAGQNGNPGAQQSLAAANLEALSNALSTAKAARVLSEARWREAQRTPGMGLSEILENQTVQQISQDRAKLLAQYQQSLSVYKPDYPDMLQLKAQINETDRQLALQAADIRKAIQVQYETALDNERALTGQVGGLKNDVLDLSKRSIQYTILQREVDTNRTLYDGLLHRYK
ncbi:MAG TPA: GumC family protein, partial [Caulobacteraceae bacterium]